MKQVYLASDFLSVQLVKDYLESSGIECMIKGELLIGAIGELPANSYPSIWVIDDENYAEAKLLVEKYEKGERDDRPDRGVWKCIGCDELIDAQFTQCWKCGKERTD